MSMVLHKTAVTPLLMHWSYCSLAQTIDIYIITFITIQICRFIPKRRQNCIVYAPQLCVHDLIEFMMPDLFAVYGFVKGCRHVYYILVYPSMKLFWICHIIWFYIGSVFVCHCKCLWIVCCDQYTDRIHYGIFHNSSGGYWSYVCQFPSYTFLILQKCPLDPLISLHIWQVLPQIICGATSEIRTCHITGKGCLLNH